jgi:hypothetical protein
MMKLPNTSANSRTMPMIWNMKDASPEVAQTLAVNA